MRVCARVRACVFQLNELIFTDGVALNVRPLSVR